MDRYVLVVYFNQEENAGAKALEYVKQIYDKLGLISSSNVNSERKISLFPGESFRSFFSCSRQLIVSRSTTQPNVETVSFVVPQPAPSLEVRPHRSGILLSRLAMEHLSAEWEELGAGQKNESEEESPNAMEACLNALEAEAGEGLGPLQHTELYEEAAEGLNLLADKLPPPGKALIDVVFLGIIEEAPDLKDLLPVIGSLKHMQAWHSAKITIVTDHQAGWKKQASYLSASVVEPSRLESCVDDRELWRGGVLIREKKFASEVRFEGLSLRSMESSRSQLHSEGSLVNTGHLLHAEVFHYYRSVLDLVHLVTVSDLPSFLHSSTEFHLGLSCKSVKTKLLLEQLKSLSGKVGALFSLSCTVSSVALPPATQLSSQKWKDLLARRPKALPVSDVEVKGETGRYFLLVQGSEGEGCKARMIHSAKQINGAAAMATVNGLLREKALSSSGSNTSGWLRSLPCLHGDQLLQRERTLTKVQTLVIKECLRRRQEAEKPASIPVNDLKVLLSLAREQYLRKHDSTLPEASSLHRAEEKENYTVKTTAFQKHSQCSKWPERCVLQNHENIQKTRQKLRLGVSSGGSSDCLLGPKDAPSQRVTTALLDAKELLRHFTAEGLPSGELQPLLVQRIRGNAFQMSPDLTPIKVTQLPFNEAASAHYHGLEFCLDEQGQTALDRDRSFVKLQSRLIRYETQTTCSKEPCPVPFALSPAPSPAVLSEPGSVPDGESLLNSDLPRIKRRSWDTDVIHPHKRLSKSESSESLGSMCSGGSGTHPTVRALRHQPSRSQSTSSVSALRRPPPEPHSDYPQGDAAGQAQARAEDNPSKESRSQKHIRMLKDVVAKTLKHQGITSQHECFAPCSQKLFEISKFYLKDLKTSRGLHEEMKKAANSNVKQVIDWVTEKGTKK